MDTPHPSPYDLSRRTVLKAGSAGALLAMLEGLAWTPARPALAATTLPDTERTFGSGRWAWRPRCCGPPPAMSKRMRRGKRWSGLSRPVLTELSITATALQRRRLQIVSPQAGRLGLRFA